MEDDDKGEHPTLFNRSPRAMPERPVEYVIDEFRKEQRKAPMTRSLRVHFAYQPSRTHQYVKGRPRNVEPVQDPED